MFPAYATRAFLQPWIVPEQNVDQILDGSTVFDQEDNLDPFLVCALDLGMESFFHYVSSQFGQILLPVNYGRHIVDPGIVTDPQF